MRKTIAGLLDGGVVNVYACLYCVCSSAASGPRMEIIVYTRS
jgi:hypothetical protein